MARWDMGCCCGDICTEFYCSNYVPAPLRRPGVYIVHYEDNNEACNHDNNYIVVDNREEAEKLAEEYRQKGYNVEVIEATNPKVSWIWEYYSRKPGEMLDQLLFRVEHKLAKSMLGRFYPKVKHTVFLVDGSGSMEPAWSEAWATLFDMLRKTESSFSILLFKQPRYLTEAEEQAVILTDNRYFAIIDVAQVLRRKNLVRIKKAPTPMELGIKFRGRTPLLASIAEAMALAREEYPNARITMYVVSDNRDSMIAKEKEYNYTDADIITIKRKLGVRLVLLPVGHFLKKYVEKYDMVQADSTNDNTLVLSLI